MEKGPGRASDSVWKAPITGGSGRKTWLTPPRVFLEVLATLPADLIRPVSQFSPELGIETEEYGPGNSRGIVAFQCQVTEAVLRSLLVSHNVCPLSDESDPIEIEPSPSRKKRRLSAASEYSQRPDAPEEEDVIDID